MTNSHHLQNIQFIVEYIYKESKCEEKRLHRVKYKRLNSHWILGKGMDISMSDDFKKEYEYTEEKRGAILVFVLMILSIDILMAIFYTAQVSGYFTQIPVLNISFLALGILYILFIIFTAATCYRLKKSMFSVSKIYLVIRAVYTLYSSIIIFVHSLNDPGVLKEYDSVFIMIFSMLLLPLAYMAAFSIGWYLYFKKSKKCKELMKSFS
jgi:hypothetical protein